jgi:hypothetical protein
VSIGYGLVAESRSIFDFIISSDSFSLKAVCLVLIFYCCDIFE